MERREGRRTLPLAPSGGDRCQCERARDRLPVARVRNGPDSRPRDEEPHGGGHQDHLTAGKPHRDRGRG
jgi:hypothetical protein